MNTSEKAKTINNFLSSPNNKLIFSRNGENIHADIFFDIEVSETDKNIDFSICVEASNLDEAVLILSNVSRNKDVQSIRDEIQDKLNSSFINPNDKFFLIVKGNKRERT